jgi:predicted unusual protein kinase regulating ubiquinone biosynthesis (AarF/ABC1/UbiB family)
LKKQKQLKKIKQSGLQRSITISLAGAQGGVRLLGNHLFSALLPEQKKQAVRLQSLANEAELFTHQLGELKGAYVKIGQMMALYGDHFLPKQVSDALHCLEHKTSSVAWTAIEPIIEAELGDRMSDLSVDKKPIAAASLSQVHRALLNKDGRELVIKVQYPGVANTIDSDFRAVLQMMKLGRWAKTGRDFESWTQEIKAMLVDEVDYHRERVMTERVAELLANDPRYLLPKIDKRYSSERILTMDYLRGVEVSHPRVAKLSLKRRNALAKAMLEVFFKEVFEWGIMQTDPNFGNYRVQFAEKRDPIDKLVLLDFGAVRELDPSFLQALQKTIIAAYQNDRVGVMQGATLLNCISESQTDRVRESFADFCILLMEPFRKHHQQTPGLVLNDKRQYMWHDSQLLRRAGKLGAKSIGIEGFTSPPKEFALIARKLTGVFTFITTLRAEFNADYIIEQYIER